MTRSAFKFVISATILFTVLLASVLSNIPVESASADDHQTFLPQVVKWNHPPMVYLDSVTTLSTTGIEKNSFIPSNGIHFVARGMNYNSTTAQVNLRWQQEGPCGTTQVYNETISLPPGAWEHIAPWVIPDCPGIYIGTAEVTNQIQTESLKTLYVVNPISTVITDTLQAFDRCYLPTVDQMAIWWQHSPYKNYNIYIGGSMFFCQNDIPDAFWVHQVASQGWSFILTWVGPQAPCTNFRIKMSSNAATAYQQGRSEAEAAVQAAEAMGILGHKAIYYDMEAYGSQASAECRVTVASFMRGWTARLHDLGHKSGGYGSPSTSHIADWASNNPPPDYIWIAHWLLPYQYRPDATVWTSLLSNNLWNNHQRLRQYAGGHSETYNGVALTIDSNAVDGALTSLPFGTTSLTSSDTSTIISLREPPMQIAGVFPEGTGWVLRGEQLLKTLDAGRTWQDVTPEGAEVNTTLTAHFTNPLHGWVVRQSGDLAIGEALQMIETSDGGITWISSKLSLVSLGQPDSSIDAAYLSFIDASTGWLALKLQSGSNFSIGRLFTTDDGGKSWEERSLPIGEPVRFTTPVHGWTAGGPADDQLYHTQDGGWTWQLQDIPLPFLEEGRYFIGLPEFIDENNGYLPVTAAIPDNSALLVFETNDSGVTWSLANHSALDKSIEPGAPLAFTHSPTGEWVAATAGSSLYTSSRLDNSQGALPSRGLSQGVVEIAFATPDQAWALSQSGECTGDKRSMTEGTVQCTQYTRLYSSSDGGVTWYDITP